MRATIGSDLVAKKYDIIDFTCVTARLKTQPTLVDIKRRIMQKKTRGYTYIYIPCDYPRRGKRNKVHVETFHSHFKQHLYS